MKRKGLLAGLVLALGLTLASCGINAKTAEKINVAAAKGDNWTYEEVVDRLGKPTVDGYVDLGVLGKGGIVTYYVGYDTYEAAKAAYDEGKTVKILTITLSEGVAKEAKYSEWAKEAE